MDQTSAELEAVISHEYAQVGAVRLHYARAGTGDRLVVLLHGFPECWYSWRRQILALAGDRYTVVAPDLRGYNLSDKPPHKSDYEMNKLVDDVTGLIRHLGRESAAVIGHDWGAAITWNVGLRHPEYVWKLGALQVPPMAAWQRNMSFKQLLASWYMFFFQLPRIPEWFVSRNDFAGLKEAFKTTTARPGVFTDADIDVYKKSLSEPGALKASFDYYRANFWSRFLKRPSNKNVTGDAKLKMPVLFIYGEKDTAVLPSTVRGVGDYVEGPFTEVRIPEAAHWVQQEAPDKVTAAIREFLD